MRFRSALLVDLTGLHAPLVPTRAELGTISDPPMTSEMSWKCPPP